MTLFYGIKWHPQLFCLQKSSNENRLSAGRMRMGGWEAGRLWVCRILEHHLATTQIHSTPLHSSCSLWAVNCPSYRIKKKKLSWYVSVIWPELFREHRQMPFKCFNLTCPIKNAAELKVLLPFSFFWDNWIKWWRLSHTKINKKLNSFE